jgi:hypothetical protein
MVNMISIKGLSKAIVLKCLWDNAKYIDREEIQAKYIKTDFNMHDALIATANPNKLCFDYVNGKRLMVDISGDTFDEERYESLNGTDAVKIAELAINRAYSQVTRVIVNHIINNNGNEYTKDELRSIGMR